MVQNLIMWRDGFVITSSSTMMDYFPAVINNKW